MTCYGRIVKNRVAQLEKSEKKAKETLDVTGAKLPHENNIHKNSYIMDNWHEARIFYSWFYQIKYLVADQFDDISAAIINSDQDIDLNIINTN